MAEYPWMTDMFVAIGEGVVKTAPWGLMFRVLLGATTSTIDLGTDIFVCYMFWKEKRMDYFEMTLGTILLSMSLQLLIVAAQNKKRGIKRVVLEALPVLVGLKPAVDAYRIAGRVEEDSKASIDTLMELTCVKCR